MNKLSLKAGAKITMIALAASVSLPQIAHAQTADAATAREQIDWALNDLDRLLERENQLDRQGRQLDQRRSELQQSERWANTTIDNFNQHCTNGRWATNCNGWQRELDNWQVGFDRDLGTLNEDYDRLNAELRRSEDQIQRKRSEMMTSVGELLRACRAMAPAARGNHCTIPATGRYTGDFVNEARNRLRSAL